MQLKFRTVRKSITGQSSYAGVSVSSCTLVWSLFNVDSILAILFRLHKLTTSRMVSERVHTVFAQSYNFMLGHRECIVQYHLIGGMKIACLIREIQQQNNCSKVMLCRPKQKYAIIFSCRVIQRVRDVHVAYSAVTHKHDVCVRGTVERQLKLKIRRKKKIVFFPFDTYRYKAHARSHSLSYCMIFVSLIKKDHIHNLHLHVFRHM